MSFSGLAELDGNWIDGLSFCAAAYKLLEEIRFNNEIEFGGRRSSDSKKLIEEILPICIYIQMNYRAGAYISVRWLSGSQSYDAEIKRSGLLNSEDAVEYLEVTYAAHDKDYLSREFLSVNGYSPHPSDLRRSSSRDIKESPSIKNNIKIIDEVFERVLHRIKAKAYKEPSYRSGTTLIVALNLSFPMFGAEWQSLKDRIRSMSPENNFKDIFVCDMDGVRAFGLKQNYFDS